MKNKILITGATGFLGSRLLKELEAGAYPVIMLRRKDLSGKNKGVDGGRIILENIFKKNKIAAIIHLATDYGRKNKADINNMLFVNIVLPAQLLVLAKEYKVAYFINAHTSLPGDYNPYSATKNAFIDLAKFFVKNSKISFINMVIENMYGEKDKNSSFVVDSIKSALSGKQMDATRGKQKRDFIYVGDVAAAFLKAMKRLKNFKKGFTEISIGTGKAISLKEWAGKIAGISGKKMRMNWGARPYPEHEKFYLCADLSAAKKLLGWQPKVSLEEGLGKTLAWYKQNRKQ